MPRPAKLLKQLYITVELLTVEDRKPHEREGERPRALLDSKLGNACQSFLEVLIAPDKYPGQETVGNIGNLHPASLKEGQVGLGNLVEADAEEAAVHLDEPQELVEGAEDPKPEFKIAEERAAAEPGLGREHYLADLVVRQAEAAELGDAGGQGLPHVGAEESGIFGDDGGEVGAGDVEAGQEGDDGVGLRGRPEGGDAFGCLEGLLSGEAASGDEVVGDREGVARGGGGGTGEEAMEGGDAGGGAAGRGE